MTDKFISIDVIARRYPAAGGGATTIFENLWLSMARGEFGCVIGLSGCGKTTVLNMVAGFEPASAGAIRLGGQLIAGPAADRGVVFQGDDSLYGWLTALGNVEFGLRMSGMARHEREAKARRYLQLVGLEGQDHKHPAELSGGMKQRIQIARVLANEPDMLLMDEPFAALDAHTRADMQRELKRICSATGKTVLFITHDIDEAIILADRIGVMHAGPASKLKGIVRVDLSEAERERTHDRFVAVYRQVHEMIRDEVAISLKRSHG